MYHFMRQNIFEPDFIEIVGHTAETGKHIWIAGERFAESVPIQTLTLDPSYGTRMPDIFDTSIPLMSERLLKSILDLGIDNIDSYPMILHRPDTDERWRNYSAINVIGRIDAVDMKASEYVMRAVGKPKFEKIVLDASAIGDAICFRLATGPGFIVVHDSIKSQLSGGAFAGLMFQKVQDYRRD